MTLGEEIEETVKNIFAQPFKERLGQKVPTNDDITLLNDAVKLDASVLYADISDSTKLVDNYEREFAAKVYKAFLRSCNRIITYKGGVVTAYDGDRIMGVWHGDNKNIQATAAALMIRYAVTHIINPSIKKKYTSTNYVLKHTVAVDTSELYVVKGGVRGSNDLLWIGRAANYAAKMTTLSDETPTWITEDVYQALPPNLKEVNGKSVWTRMQWNAMGRMNIYCSTYHMAL